MVRHHLSDVKSIYARKCILKNFQLNRSIPQNKNGLLPLYPVIGLDLVRASPAPTMAIITETLFGKIRALLEGKKEPS